MQASQHQEETEEQPSQDRVKKRRPGMGKQHRVPSPWEHVLISGGASEKHIMPCTTSQLEAREPGIRVM